MKWDEGVKFVKNLQKPTQNLQISHRENKSPMGFKNWDFVEKRIFFKDKDASYIYLSYIPDKVPLIINDHFLQILPPKKEAVRAKTIFGCFKAEKTETQTRLMICQQNDLQIGFATSMVAPLLPKGMGEWAVKLRRYL